MHIFCCVYLFSRNMIFVHIWRVFIFANVVQKKISCVFSFPKSTKIREICKNMYTLKVVCLGYVWYCRLSIPIKGYTGVWTSSKKIELPLIGKAPPPKKMKFFWPPPYRITPPPLFPLKWKFSGLPLISAILQNSDLCKGLSVQVSSDPRKNNVTYGCII